MKLSLLSALRDAAEDVQKSADSSVSPAQFNPGGSYGGGTGGQPIVPEWSEERAINEGYKGSTWPFVCIDRLGGACSSVPWRVLQKKGGGPKPPGKGMSNSGEWEAQDGHPLELLIERPNEILSRQFLVNVMVLHLGCNGNSTLRVISTGARGKERPAELWPISRYKPVPVDERKPAFRNGKQVVWLQGYKRTDRPEADMLYPEQVIHAMFPDPGNLLWGMSPMRAVAAIIDMDRMQVAWNAQLPKDFNVPRGAIVDKNLTTDGQLTEAASLIEARMRRRDGTPLVLGAGTDYLRMSLSPVEVDWVNARERSMIEICAAHGLLPSLFISDSKYANQESAIRHMWKNGAHRNLSVIEDAFNTKLVPLAERGKTWIHFDLSVIPDIQDTLPQRLEAHERAVRSGIPANRSFVLLDLPIAPVPGGDEPLVAGTLISLEQLVAPPDPGGQDDGTDDLSPVPADPKAAKPNGADPGTPVAADPKVTAPN